MAAALTTNAFAQPQYSSTNTTPSTYQGAPFLKDSMKNKTQILYKPSDFMGVPAGEMVAVYVKAAGIAPDGTPIYQNFSIKMKQYQSDTFDVSSSMDFVSGLTTVFSTPTYMFGVTVSNGKWLKFPLQTPFPFSRDSNLVVEIEFGPDRTTTSSFNLACFGSPGATRLYGKFNAATATTFASAVPVFGFDYASTGIGNTGNATSVEVFPNPATEGRFNVSIDPARDLKDVSVSVTNITGQQVYQSRGRTAAKGNLYSIDLRNAPKGLYFVEVLTDGNRMVKILSVQ
jgi:hypothetical protein